MLKVSVNVFDNNTIEWHFKDLFNDILYFSVAQIFIDFVFFAYLSNRGKV